MTSESLDFQTVFVFPFKEPGSSMRRLYTDGHWDQPVLMYDWERKRWKPTEEWIEEVPPRPDLEYL